MDYTSIKQLAFWLGKLFWADLERHRPGIDSLRLDPEVAAAWKKRVAVRVDSKGVEVPRNNRHVVLATVRAFYLDLNQWAYEDPARWAARERVWLGEVAGLQQTLVALRAKTEHAERLAAAGITDTLSR